MSFSWKFGYRSWSQKLPPLCRCTKCSMLSVLSSKSPAIKLFSNKAHVGTFKEGTAFLGSDLGLRVLEMNLGPFKTEWKVLGPWSLDFCMVSTLSIKNETRARCSMLTASFGWTPLAESSFFTQGCCSWAHFAWLKPRSVGKQQFYWKKIYRKVWFLKFWVSEFSSLRRIRRIRCKRFHVNRPFSPNSRWKWCFFQNPQGALNVRKGICPLWEQNNNFLHKGVLAEIKAWVSPVLLPNCGSSIFGHKTVVQRGVSPFWDPEKQFLSRSVLLKLIRFEWMSFSWKFGYRSWSQKLSPLCRCTKCFMLSVLSFNSPGIMFSKKAHVGTFKEGTAFLGSDLGPRVLEMNLGPFKTEWKVLGPWSLDFCMVSTLSIKDETCARCSMLTTFGLNPTSWIIILHAGLLQLGSFCLIYIGLEALESNNFTEKRLPIY